MSRRRAGVTGDQIERIAAGSGDHHTDRLPVAAERPWAFAQADPVVRIAETR